MTSVEIAKDRTSFSLRVPYWIVVPILLALIEFMGFAVDGFEVAGDTISDSDSLMRLPICGMFGKRGSGSTVSSRVTTRLTAWFCTGRFRLICFFLAWQRACFFCPTSKRYNTPAIGPDRFFVWASQAWPIGGAADTIADRRPFRRRTNHLFTVSV